MPNIKHTQLNKNKILIITWLASPILTGILAFIISFISIMLSIIIAIIGLGVFFVLTSFILYAIIKN